MYQVTVKFTNGEQNNHSVKNIESTIEKFLEDYFLTRKYIAKISWRKL